MGKSLVFLVVIHLFFVLPAGLHAATYSSTVNFDTSRGYSDNYIWSHDLTSVPANCKYTSAQITLRAKVFGWPFPYAPLHILASDTNSFNYPSDSVYKLTSSTHPSPSSFYTTTFPIPSNKLNWLSNDNGIYLEMLAPFGAVYYLGFSTLEVECTASTGPPTNPPTPTSPPAPKAENPWPIFIPIIMQAGSSPKAPCEDLAGCYQGAFTDNCDGTPVSGGLTLTVNNDCSFSTLIDLGVRTSGELTTRNGSTYSGFGQTDSNGCGAFTVSCTDKGASVTCEYTYSNGSGGQIPGASATVCK